MVEVSPFPSPSPGSDGLPPDDDDREIRSGVSKKRTLNAHKKRQLPQRQTRDVSVNLNNNNNLPRSSPGFSPPPIVLVCVPIDVPQLVADLAAVLDLPLDAFINPTFTTSPCQFTVVIVGTLNQTQIDALSAFLDDTSTLENLAGVNIVDAFVERDLCPNDPRKKDPGICGCGVADYDEFGHRVAKCAGCPGGNIDSDRDGVPDCLDGCPHNPDLIEPGPCLCNNCEGGHLLELTAHFNSAVRRKIAQKQVQTLNTQTQTREKKASKLSEKALLRGQRRRT